MLFKECPYKVFEVKKEAGFVEVDIEELEVGDIFRVRINGELIKRTSRYKHRHVNYGFMTYKVGKESYTGIDGIKRIGGVENG